VLFRSMASVKGTLVGKLQRELQIVGGNPEQAADVQALLDEVQGIPEAELKSDNESPVMDKLIVRLSQYGRKWKVRDLGMERRDEDADVADLVKEARSARARAVASLGAMPKSTSQGKAYAVAGSLERISGWGSLDKEDEASQQRGMETRQGLFEVGERMRRAMWRGTETLIGPDGEPEERPLLPEGAPEDLDKAIERWKLGEKPKKKGKGKPKKLDPDEAPIRAVRRVKDLSSREQRELLFTQGHYTHTFFDEDGEEWTREVRVAPDPAEGEVAGVFMPVMSPFEGGESGKYATAHAEQQVHRLAEGVPIGIAGTTDTTRVVCGECRTYFRSEAVRLKKPLVIAEHGNTLVFHENGEIEDMPG